jgi:DNA repair protein RadA/Sms
MTISVRSKPKTTFACSQCGGQFPKWTGNCSACGAWNSLCEEVLISSNSLQNASSRFAGFAGVQSHIQQIADIALTIEPRIETGTPELDRVLGGGLVLGSVILLGGDPGIGKSTILIQALSHLSQHHSVLYVTGEESLQQVAQRAKRLDLAADKINLLAETQIEQILLLAKKHLPKIIVIDSIQTVFTELFSSAPGSVGQVRESAAQLVRYAKHTNTILFLVGHVTKEGTLAGPRILEHMVDTVLYFEGEQDSRYRIIRAIKNRFGAVNELGVFAMTEKGLKEITNPSAIFLSKHSSPVPGSITLATMEGTRPLLVEVQALVSQSYGQNPRRLAQGLDQNRLSMLLAILQRHGNVSIYDQDVFVNIAGGIKISETASDLALLLAIISSLKNKPLPNDLMVFGEVGLAGEIRPVQGGQERLREAEKQGYKKALVPFSNKPKIPFKNLEVVAVKLLKDALSVF